MALTGDKAVTWSTARIEHHARVAAERYGDRPQRQEYMNVQLAHALVAALDGVHQEHADYLLERVDAIWREHDQEVSRDGV